ncbi:MAG: tetratricopeptide repeat protein [Treponema sp.]|nr:tetratricopeptide repeat protein [Treponema sp.]
MAEQNAENWYEASQFFLEAVHLNSVYGDAWYRLAECTYQLGRYELALDYLKSADRYARNNTAVKNLRGMCYIALGNTEQARVIFESVLASSPNDVNARFGMAELELLEGRISGAESRYAEALQREPSNRKALLSLAFVSARQGKSDVAQRYMSQAMRYYSGEAEVHFLSATLSAMNGNYAEAERQARTAVEINGNYDKAYELLASILYFEKKYSEVIDVCDFRIGRNRAASSAWYLKGLSQERLGRVAAAISTWTTGLSVEPLDEVMRAALELQINKTVAVEDERRSSWAQYHVKNAQEYMKRYDSIGASYEYQRALKVHPTNETARIAFAEMLAINGLHELYLEQLKFVQDNRAPLESISSEARRIRASRMDDAVEAYDSLLQDALAKRWDVEPFYLDKIRWHIGIYYTASSAQLVHADNARITAEMLADMFSGVSVTSVEALAAPVAGFGDAYRKARAAGEDYFVILSIDEGERDIVLSGTMYSGRTGSAVRELSFYGTGNNRYTNVLRRFRSSLLESLPIRGKILDRSGSDVLIDVGRSEMLRNGAIFAVVRKGAVLTADARLGLTYRESDNLGTLTITETGEEVSEGVLSKKGFYDRVNTGDEVVLISMPKEHQNGTGDAMRVVDTVPNANLSGDSVIAVERESIKALTSDDKGSERTPALFDLIRGIY